MTKKKFLENLEKALKKIICEIFNENNVQQKRVELEQQVEEFVRENAGEYTLEELMETFISADAAIALFLEFQDAKRICGETEIPSGYMVNPPSTACT